MTSKPFERIAADSNVVLSAAVSRAALNVFRRAKGLQVVTTDANFCNPAMGFESGLSALATN